MQGPVTVCSDLIFKKLLQIILPLDTESATLGKLFIPPLPRYVFGGCCKESDHCTNRREVTYQKKLLDKVDHLWALLKSKLKKLGTTKHWVMDGWRDLIRSS